MHLSWAPSDAQAVQIAREQWANGLLSPPVTWDLEQPEDFEREVGEVDDAEIRNAVLVDHDIASLASRIADLVDIGFGRVYLHHVGNVQSEFLRLAASDLIPALKEQL